MWIWELADAVRSGAFEAELTRPGDVLSRLLVFDLGRSANLALVRVTAPLLGAALLLDLVVPTTVGGWALVPVSVALAAVMGFCVRFLIGASAFWTPDYRGVYSLAFPLVWFLSGFLIPVEFFPGALRTVAEFGPLAAMLTAPVRVVTGRATGGALALQLVWVVVLVAACRVVLAAGERRWVVPVASPRRRHLPAAARCAPRRPARPVAAARTLGSAALVLFETVGIVLCSTASGASPDGGAGDVAVLVGLGGGRARVRHAGRRHPRAAGLLVAGARGPARPPAGPALPRAAVGGDERRPAPRASAGGWPASAPWRGGRRRPAWTGRRRGSAWRPCRCSARGGGARRAGARGQRHPVHRARAAELVNAFTYGGAALSANPLQIYGSVLRFVFLWVVPFGLAVYVPALHVLDREGPPGAPASLLAVTPLATVAFAAVAGLAWRRGLRHYASTGS